MKLSDDDDDDDDGIFVEFEEFLSPLRMTALVKAFSSHL